MNRNEWYTQFALALYECNHGDNLAKTLSHCGIVALSMPGACNEEYSKAVDLVYDMTNREGWESSKQVISVLTQTLRTLRDLK